MEMKLGLPTDKLFEMMMKDGPLPRRYHSLPNRLGASPVLEYAPEELIEMRGWWLAQQSTGNIEDDHATRACARGIEQGFYDSKKCLLCGSDIDVEETRPQQAAYGFIPAGPPETRSAHCERCGERP